MRHLFTAGAILAAAALLIWAFRPAPVAVETATVLRGDLTVEVEAEGEARVREVMNVSAPITGQLRRVTLHAGDQVTAGQPLLQIGPVVPGLLDARARAIAEATAAAAAAAVDLARSQLDTAEATRDFARAEADRARALFARAALSQRALEDARLAEHTAAAAAASAQANLVVREREWQSAQAVLGVADGRAAECCLTVTAPVAGTILRNVTEDEQVVQAGTPILQIGDLSRMEVVVHVLSSDAVGITPGAPARITGWGGADLPARVERVEPSATTRLSALGIDEQRVEVRLALLDAPPAALGHGFRVTARITVDQARAVAKIPVGALFRRGADWAVLIVEDGRAAQRPVSLGLRNAEEAEVTSGLAEGAIVILHPDEGVTDGTRVLP